MVAAGVVKGKHENVAGTKSGGVLIYKERINRQVSWACIIASVKVCHGVYMVAGIRMSGLARGGTLMPGRAADIIVRREIYHVDQVQPCA